MTTPQQDLLRKINWAELNGYRHFAAALLEIYRRECLANPPRPSAG